MTSRPPVFDPSRPLPLQGLSPTGEAGTELEERASPPAPIVPARQLDVPPSSPRQVLQGGALITERRRSRTGSRWEELDFVDADGVCAPGPIRRKVRPRTSKHFLRSRRLMELAGVTLEPIEQVTGRTYEARCEKNIISVWAHPSNFAHIASAEAFAAAEMFSHLGNANIISCTRLMDAIPLVGLTASALDPLAITEAFLREIHEAFHDANACLSAFSEIVVKEVSGDVEDDGKTGVFIRDAVSDNRRTFAEWREHADEGGDDADLSALEPGLYLVPHFHLLLAVMDHDGTWWTQAQIRQRLNETVRRERQASLPKKLGGRRRGGHTSTRGHVMSCVEYSIKRLNRMNDDELLLTNLWRAMAPNSGFVNAVLSAGITPTGALRDFLARREAALSRTLIDKNHLAGAGSVAEIVDFLTSCPRLVSINIIPSESISKTRRSWARASIGLVWNGPKLLVNMIQNWFRKRWPP